MWGVEGRNSGKSINKQFEKATHTPRKINMEPKNGGVEDDVPLQLFFFLGGSMLIFQGVSSEMAECKMQIWFQRSGINLPAARVGRLFVLCWNFGLMRL